MTRAIPVAGVLMSLVVVGCSRPGGSAALTACRQLYAQPSCSARCVPSSGEGVPARCPAGKGADGGRVSPRAEVASRAGVVGPRTDASPRATWFDAGVWLQVADESAGGEDPLTDLGYVPREYRRGPAYPDDVWRSLGREGKEWLPMMWDDTVATFTDPGALVMFALAGATCPALGGANGNEPVADHFGEHGNPMNTEWDMVGDVGGNPATHFALGGAMWLGGLAGGDTKTFEVGKSLLSALSINGLTTLTLKTVARTESPNGDEFGWPSGHTSSSFCLAAVMYEHYGPWVGVPLYGFASFVGFERLAARNHDFNDVVAGALIGAAIGHAVARNHQPKVLGMDVIPYSDPRRGGVGIALHKRW